ncbi:MAG TPA: Rrf2 family transcriptional regulator [Longimicrobiales bacterium]|nr:Rrf2 family transcriptional regulator [Longimicrobiales bacterium]
MLNQSADYAVRAVLFVAQRDSGRSCTAGVIARAIGVPRNYLGKVLHALATARVLTSVRGPRGGFRLARSADELTLADVAGPFQRLPERTVCLLGDRSCDPAHPCGSHAQWQSMADQMTAFFRTTTISALLGGAPSSTNSLLEEDA